MGLAGPKIKQRISANPRNVAWSNDTKKFGHQMLLKMGWEPGKGLGLDENGVQENIKLSIKKDNLGIGASKKTVDNWLDNSTAFDELLKGLNQQTQINCDIEDNNSSLSSSPSSSPKFEIKLKTSESDNSSNMFSSRLAHRAKFLKSKKAVMKNTKRINEIMGIKSKSSTIDDNKIDGTIDDTNSSNFERNSNNSDDNDNKEDNLSKKNQTNDLYGK
ncbi:2902_t:CDS:2 [Diversispora eburnea]|uniref:2902_t:CDS:1 n=1 Tax=Diversispora eburnea TaxID=1213867 RepID=A0A9N8ZKI7_9GLOM|nr:2902_t:CDS:2 [Diversispora eburnea]